jgi:stage II sporulation protein D
MKFRTMTIILLMMLPLTGRSQISIRIFARTRPATIIFTAEKGGYLLRDGAAAGEVRTAGADASDATISYQPAAAGERKAGGEMQSAGARYASDVRLSQGDVVIITSYDNRVIYRTLSGTCGAADSLSFIPYFADALFRVRIPGNPEPGKILNGKLTIKPFPGSLQILNYTTVEECLPGVVRAEAGKFGPSHYFRAQAVVARTYIYRNIERHALDGYNLCDDIHCQVYPGVVTDTVIVNACRSTSGKVLTGSDSLLIEAAFHGNCGGETASSADVWLAGYPYLVSIRDPWCSYSASSAWKMSIPRAEWNSFLLSKGITPGTEGNIYSSETSGLSAGQSPSQPPGAGRVTSRTVQGKIIRSEEIRLRFGLRSAYFTPVSLGDSIIFNGRGYGHGVGLCQDGAKHMAEKKMTYNNITGFYYPGTIIIDIKNARRPPRP